METYIAYGMRIDNWKLKPEAYISLMIQLTKAASKIEEQAYDFFKDNKDNYDSYEMSFYDFCDSYENDNMHSGIDAVITDFINETRFQGEPVFVCEDCTIHVPLYIRETDDKNMDWKYPSKETVRRILSEVVGPLLEEDQIVDYYTIHT